MNASPPSLLEFAERLEDLADRVQDRSSENARAAVAQDRHKRLIEEANVLDALLGQVRELNLLGTGWPEVPQLDGFKVSKAERDEQWLVSQAGLNFLDALTSISQAVGAVVEEAWEERIDEHASEFPDKATLRLLRERGGDDDTLEAIDTLEHLSHDFAELREKARPEPGDAELLTQLESQSAASWGRVRAGGELSEDRLELLRSVNSIAGKPLTEISEEDLLWLRNSGTAWSLIVRRRA